MQIIYVKPEMTMQMWKALAQLSALQRCKQQGLFNAKLEKMYNDTSKFMAVQNERIQNRIYSAFNKYLPYTFVPDLCEIQYDENAVEIDKDRCAPSMHTQNVFTFNTLSEILLDSPNPKTVMFMMSENCNLRCKYCFESHAKQTVMSFDDAKALVDSLFTDTNVQQYLGTENQHSIILEFMGGEPLLQADLVKQICDYFLECCLKYERFDWLLYHTFNITTNGTLYFKEEVQNLIAKFPELQLTISIDGIKECHNANRVYKDGSGSFDDTILAVKEEIRRGRLNMPRITFSSNTIPYLCDSVEMLERLGAPAVSIAPVLEENYSSKDAYLYYKQLVKIVDYLYITKKRNFVDVFANCVLAVRGSSEPFCGGEGGMLTLNPDGTYTTCHRMHDQEGQIESVTLGNTKEGFLGTEQFQKNYQYLKENGIFNKVWPKKCTNCPFTGRCVGCPAVNLEKTKSLKCEVNTNGCLLNLARYAAFIYYQMRINGVVHEAYVKEHYDKFAEFLPIHELERLCRIEKKWHLSSSIGKGLSD